MTLGEYVGMMGIEANDALFATSGLTKDDEFVEGSEDVMNAVLDAVRFAIVTPYRKSVSENGFSVSWDRSRLGNLYLLLCKKWGRTPDPDALSDLGITSIRDLTDTW